MNSFATKLANSGGAHRNLAAIASLALLGSLTPMSMAQAEAALKVTAADIDKDGLPDAVVENDLIRVSIAARGGGITGFYDKTRHHEEAKTFPSADDDGLNQLRIAGVQSDADTAKFELSHRAGEHGEMIVEAVGDVTLTINDDKVGPLRMTRRYVLDPGSSRVGVITHVENKTTQEINFVPWVKHLLMREGPEHSRVAFLTTYGAYQSDNPIPGRNGAMFLNNVHYATSSNWISRSPVPLNEVSNTLATVTAALRMFKVYGWKKPSENYISQEVIFGPRVLKPGQSDEFEYFITLTAPLAAPAYCSPLLNVEVTPHPMGIPADTKQLEIRFAPTRDLGDVDASGELKRLDANEPAQPLHLHFANLIAQGSVTVPANVNLAPKGRYQLELNLTSQGKALLPGADVGDKDPIRIPVVVDDKSPATAIFPSRTDGNLFKARQPQLIQAPLASEHNGLSVYRVPATERVFEFDTFKPAGQPKTVDVEAGANEFRSFQLVLVSKKQAPATYSVETSPLTGAGTGQVDIDRVSRMLYAETKVPSGYNPAYGLGRYPEGLLATKEIEVRPGVTAPLYLTYHVPAGTKPGDYRGQVTLKSGGDTLVIPVSMHVWNYELPLRPPVDVIADPKSGGASVVPIYLRYKVTPSYLPGLTSALQTGDFATVERDMPGWIAQGISRTYLGNIVELEKLYGPDRIKAIDAFLKQHGWTNYFYVRPGYDEGSTDKVPEIKAAAQSWKALSSIPVMETYYYDGRVNELYGLLDIYSRSFSKAPWITQRMKAGDQFWRVNNFPGALENEPRDTWARYLAMADYGYTGTYIWTLSAWQEGEWGKDWWADNGVSNMSATLVWKDDSGLLPTMRLESLRDGIQVYGIYDQLKKRVAKPKPTDSPQLLERAHALLGEPALWKRIKTDDDVENIHRELAEVLSGLNS